MQGPGPATALASERRGVADKEMANGGIMSGMMGLNEVSSMSVGIELTNMKSKSYSDLS